MSAIDGELVRKYVGQTLIRTRHAHFLVLGGEVVWLLAVQCAGHFIEEVLGILVVINSIYFSWWHAVPLFNCVC